MSNLFKSNSRFAALADDIPTKKDNKKPMIRDNKEDKEKKEVKEVKFNSFKSDNNSFKTDGYREYRRNRCLSEEEIQQLRNEYKERENDRKELERKEAERQKHESLKIENFPDLVLNKKEINTIQDQNYLEKLKTVHSSKDENIDIDQDLKKLQPGWILLKKDKETGKTIIKGIVKSVTTPEMTEQDINIKVIDSLSEIHEKRSQEYIELNGYDVWEKMFKSPGWMEWETEYDDNDSDYESDYSSEEDDDDYVEY
jgi:hypothetical protein